MSTFLPGPPGRIEDDGDVTTHLDPRLARVWAEHRWSLRAAQWRALAVAQAIFGPGVSVTLSGGPLEGRFRGLLHLQVPFEGLSAHRDREARFTTAAGMDPILAGVPLVYVFSASET